LKVENPQIHEPIDAADAFRPPVGSGHQILHIGKTELAQPEIDASLFEGMN
jgi:hypothetical protein